MSKIGVIGWGVVGQAVGEGFGKNPANEIFWYDKYKKGPFTFEKVIGRSEVIFVCVSTPMTASYSKIDLSNVSEVIDIVAPKISQKDKFLVIKSTVVPGTTVSFAKKYPGCKFAMSPEFLTEANAFWDFLHPDRTIIGALSESVAAEISQLYSRSQENPALSGQG